MRSKRLKYKITEWALFGTQAGTWARMIMVLYPLPQYMDEFSIEDIEEDW